jgi:ribosomal protein S18 acetylase RimI-like enzyme
MTIEKVKNLQELALFLAEINKHKESHIGYCGEKVEEIYQTIMEDFVASDGDIKFIIARNSIGKIIAAIGFDIDKTSAEVWGPFNKTASVKIQYQLWEQLVNENPTVRTFYFFINKENKNQQNFMNEIKANETGEHLILEIQEQNVEKVNEMKSVPYTASDYVAFEKLHNETFPNTYYDAKTITERLGDGNIIRVLKTKSGELQGYAYFEIDTEMAEASLEYIGISKTDQNQGLGTLMLKEALTEMFSYPQIKEIILTVENSNNQANYVYMKAGFEVKDTLISYMLKI